jgi:hypothetical protein
VVDPGIEAGDRITIACVRCRISLLSFFNRLGGSETIRPRTLVLSFCLRFLSFFLGGGWIHDILFPVGLGNTLLAFTLPNFVRLA